MGLIEGGRNLLKLGSKALGKGLEKVSPKLASRIGGSGLKVDNKLLAKYIEKSGQSGRFTIVSEASSKGERNIIGKTFKGESAVTRPKAGERVHTVLKDNITGERISLRQAASRVHGNYVQRHTAEMAESVAKRTGYKATVRMEPVKGGMFVPRSVVYNNVRRGYVPLRSEFNSTLPPRTFAALQQSLKANFGDRLGGFLANFYDRLFGMLGRNYKYAGAEARAAGTTVEGTAEAAAKKNIWSRGWDAVQTRFNKAKESFIGWRTKNVEAGMSSGAKGKVPKNWQEVSDMANSKVKGWVSGAEDINNKSAKAVRQEIADAKKYEAAEAEIAKYKTSASGLLKGDKKYTYISAKEGGKTIDSNEALKEIKEISKERLASTRASYVMDRMEKGFAQGRFEKNVADKFPSTIAESARNKGKVFYDTVTKQYVTAKQASKVVYEEELKSLAKTAEKAAGAKPKTAKELADEMKNKILSNKNYPVTEGMYNKMNQSQRARLMAIQGKEEAFEARRKAIDEMRKSADKIPSGKASEIEARTRLLGDIADKETKLNEDIAKNQQAFAELVKEADKSPVRKLGQEILKHPKIYGWGSLIGGSLLYKQVTGRGTFGQISDLVSDKDKDGNSKGVLPSATDGVFGGGTTEKMVNKVQEMYRDAKPKAISAGSYVVDGVKYVVDEARNVWQNGKEIAAAGTDEAAYWYDRFRNVTEPGQSQSVGQSQGGYGGNSQQPNPNSNYQYSDYNGWVERQPGQWGDPSDSNSYVQARGTGQAQMVNAINKATDYVEGQNLNKFDIAKSILSAYMTFMTRSPWAKAAGVALGIGTAHDINTRNQQQQAQQQQAQQQQVQQQSASQSYNRQYQQQQDNEQYVHMSM